MEWGKSKHPNAPEEHHIAFARTVPLAMGCHAYEKEETGPSMRELAGVLMMYLLTDSNCSFEEATNLLEECCYGKLNRWHAVVWTTMAEKCHDDAPGEQDEIFGLIADGQI